MFSFILGSLPLSVYALSPRVQDLHKRVKQFIDENVIPFEKDWYEYHLKPETKWTIHPHTEELKVSCNSKMIVNIGW